MLSLIACPGCRGELCWERARATCGRCGAAYPVRGGVPVLLPPAPVAPHAGRQAEAHDAAADPELDIERPRRAPALYGRLLMERHRRSVAGLEPLLRGATAVTVCGGSGMDAELLARSGAHPVATDVSAGAARRARERFARRGIGATAVVAVAERLPLRDHGVEVAYVHDGLHHLEDPLAGLREMARVAARAVIVSEPTDSPVTRAAVRAGAATDVEEPGNRVARIEPRAAARELRAAGFRLVRVRRYAMHYDPDVGGVVRALSRSRVVRPASAAARALADVGRPIGNKLVVQALR